jgi:hypothetical protein
MRKIAIATVAIALMATPAAAQYVYGTQYGYGTQYVASPTYGTTYYPSVHAAPYGYVGPNYSRQLDIATEPDPNVRLQLQSDQSSPNSPEPNF